MSSLILLLGSLDKVAEFRRSKTGGEFATFAIRENVNGKTRWWRVISFAQDVLDALREMAPGSPISVSGTVDAEIWSPPNGEPRINWRMNCDALLSPKRKRRPKAEEPPGSSDRRSGRDVASASWAAPQAGREDPNNGLPF
jgi:single-stranded DNA-binding protein